ncbi:cupin domain-containing protein [Alkalihalobacillus sp. NPDC078783]
MERIHLNDDFRHPIREFDSSAFLTRICRTTSETRVGFIHLETNGVIGSHQAVVPQLLLVVSGSGIVESAGQKLQVQVGDSFFWECGEWHQTRSPLGMSAIVIESKSLNLSLLRK